MFVANQRMQSPILPASRNVKHDNQRTSQQIRLSRQLQLKGSHDGSVQMYNTTGLQQAKPELSKIIA